MQGHRFDIFEDIGCFPALFNTIPTFFINGIWPIVIGLISASYCGKSQLSAVLSGKQNSFQYVLSGNSHVVAWNSVNSWSRTSLLLPWLVISDWWLLPRAKFYSRPLSPLSRFISTPSFPLFVLGKAGRTPTLGMSAFDKFQPLCGGVTELMWSHSNSLVGSHRYAPSSSSPFLVLAMRQERIILNSFVGSPNHFGKIHFHLRVNAKSVLGWSWRNEFAFRSTDTFAIVPQRCLYLPSSHTHPQASCLLILHHHFLRLCLISSVNPLVLQRQLGDLQADMMNFVPQLMRKTLNSVLTHQLFNLRKIDPVGKLFLFHCQIDDILHISSLPFSWHFDLYLYYLMIIEPMHNTHNKRHDYIMNAVPSNERHLLVRKMHVCIFCLIL